MLRLKVRLRYYSDHLQKYYVKFDNNSKDYIEDDDIWHSRSVCYLVDAIGFICGVLELIFYSKMVVYCNLF